MRIGKRFVYPEAKASAAGASAASGRDPSPDQGNDGASFAVLYAEVAVTIRRSRAEVAAIMFDPGYDTAWVGRIRKSASMAPGPIRRGTKIVREWRWFGRNVAETTEVVEHVPDRSLAMTTQLPFGMRIRYALEGIPEGTIARIHAEGRTTGVLRFAAGVLNALLRSAVIRDLQRLKTLLESGAWRSGGQPRGDVIGGDVIGGDVIRGDVIRGDITSGDVTSGDVTRGGVIRGKAAGGEVVGH